MAVVDTLGNPISTASIPTGNSGGSNFDWGGLLGGAGGLFSGLLGGVAAIKGNTPTTNIYQNPTAPGSGDGGGSNVIWYVGGALVLIIIIVIVLRALK